MNRNRLVLLFVCVAVMGAIVGAASSHAFLGAQVASVSPHNAECDDAFSLINPWLRCEPDENIRKKKEFSDFKLILTQHVADIKATGKASEISVYMRDLNFGPWMGIDEDAFYSSASLLKVPVLITVLRQAQENPEVLSHRVTISEKLTSTKPYYQPRTHVEVGKTYTVDELLTYMIVYSDNDAKEALGLYLQQLRPDENVIYSTFEELGFAQILMYQNDMLTVKQVASMFRVLYNTSYLSKELSQKALDLLLQSEFDGGIVGGFPSSVRVAHKFGERQTPTGVQLHDCGVVYMPKNDYLICIMTRGADMDDLSDVIQDVARTIYNELSSRN